MLQVRPGQSRLFGCHHACFQEASLRISDTLECCFVICGGHRTEGVRVHLVSRCMLS